MMYKTWKLDYFPVSLYIAILIILLCFAGITGLLLIVINQNHITVAGVVRKTIGVILAVSVSTASILGADVIQRLSNTISQATSEKAEETTYGVYVKADSSAKKLKDVKDYQIIDVKGSDNKKVSAKLNNEAGNKLTYKHDISPVNAVKDLYEDTDGNKAIVINKAYADVIQDIEKYSKFKDETKCIYTVKIQKKKTAKIDSDIVNKPFVIYLSGSDTRDEELTTSRSDVNILMAVNPVTKQILMVNTPRDYYVPNPAGGGALDKLTHCGIYGIEDSMEALSQLYDEKIDYYAQINFSGFEKVIDALGGIDVDIPEGQEVETFYVDSTLEGVHAGINHLNGARALAFARERYSYEDGDNQRGRNQMYVISLVLNKITSGSALKNYSKIFDSIQGMFTTNLSSDQISDLVKMQLQDMAKWNIKSYAVTGTGSEETTYSSGDTPLYVMNPDYSTVNKAAQLINKVMDGKKIRDKDLTTDSSDSEESSEDYESIDVQ